MRDMRVFTVAAVAVLVLVLTACDWTQWRGDDALTGFNSSETVITVGNVGTLAEQFRTTQYRGLSSVVAKGALFSGRGAFDPSGVDHCSPTLHTCTATFIFNTNVNAFT